MRFLVILLSLFFCFDASFAQHKSVGLPESVQHLIADYEQGHITRERAISEVKNMLLQSEHVIKCGNPLFHALKATPEELFSAKNPSLPETASFYTSASGKFRFEYYTTGTDSVWTADTDNSGVPDYVERAAVEMDKIWEFQIQELGFRDPLAGISPYPIQFRKLSYYGHTEFNGKKIVINSTFKGLPDNTDPEGHAIGALKVTLAHEFKHAIQYRYNNFLGDSHRWAEMDATLLEEVNYDEVNDYYNYLPTNGSLFRNPESSVVPGSYEDITFALYFHEVFGATFWTRVWQRIGNGLPDFLAALDLELQASGTNLATEYPKLVLWHFYSGARAINGFGFDEAEWYPTARESASPVVLQGSMSQLHSGVSVNRLAYRIVPIVRGSASGSVNVGLVNSTTPVKAYILNKNEIPDTNNEFDLGTSAVELFKTDRTWAQTDTQFVVIPGLTNSFNTASVRVMNVRDSDPDLFTWGDVDFSGSLNLMDVRDIMQNLLQNQSFDGLQTFVSDVSQNGTITGLDAALSLQVLNGKRAFFEIDVNQSGNMPESSQFRNNSATFFNPSADSVMLFLEPLDAETVDARIQVRLDYNTNPVAHSAIMRLPIDTTNLKLIDVKLDNFISQAQLDFTIVDEELNIIIVNDEPIPSGPIAVLYLNRKTDIETASFSFSSIEVDEFEQINLRSNRLTTELPTRIGVSIPEEFQGDAIPYQFMVSSAFPNPFNPSTTFQFSIPQAGEVQILVFNALGQLVDTFSKTSFSAGNHQIRWDAHANASGVYVVQFRYNHHIQIQKVTLLK